MARLRNKQKIAGSTVLRTYHEMEQYIRAFGKRSLNLLIILGAPGLAKSRMIRRYMQDQKYCYINGNMSAFGFFEKLHNNRNMPVILDDVDRLSRDPSAVNLMKALCETSPVKEISWHTAAPQITKGELEQSFTTSTQVAVIANDWASLDRNVLALQDRGHIVEFKPTAEEVHREVSLWYGANGEEKDVFYFIGNHLHLINNPSMRAYVLASEAKQAGLNWEEGLLQRWVSGKTYEVAKLLLNESFRNEEMRVMEYVRITGASKSDYYNRKAKLLPQSYIPHISLAIDESDVPGEEESVRETILN